jgi:LPS export ABC transporter permease LptF/LPS export ABC transporter permease LptG
MMSRLDRYILTETLGPLVLGFGVYTFIMLIRFLFQSAEMIIRRGLAAREVAELIWLSLPNILVLTIPMALLFGILIAIGRLASDSELVAMRATGMSLFALYRPILLLSLVLTGLNVGLMAYVLPRANHSLQVKRLEIIAKTAARQVEPRVFYEEWEGFLLYVYEIQPGDDMWQGVFLAPSVPSGENAVTTAKRGRLSVDDAGEQILLTLFDATTHKVDLRSPDNYQLIHHQRLDVVLDDQFTSDQRASITASKGVRELTLAELSAWRVDPEKSVELRRLAEVEIHKKFSIPAACLVFGLFAVPLGFNNRRGGKSSGFAVSIGVILVYYIMLSNGEDAARVGSVTPWLAMWLPNLIFCAFGAFLMARRNRDKSLLLGRLGRSAVLATLWNRLRHKAEMRQQVRRVARQTARLQKVPDVVLRLPRFTLRFPNTLDRYIATLYAKVFFIVCLSGLSIYIISDLTEMASHILENHPGASIVGRYYTFMSVQIFFEIAPILVLVTTLLTFSILSRSNEVMAAKALGISLYRLALPGLAVAVLVALGCVLLEAEVLPASNQKVAEFKDVIKGRAGARTYRRADRQWLFGQGDYIFNYLYFDPVRQLMRDVQVFEVDDDHQLVRRLYATRADFDPQEQRWVLADGWVRSFSATSETGYEPYATPRYSPYPEAPDYFLSGTRQPEEMHFSELKHFIRELEHSGQRVPELKVELHNKLAFPAVSFVMALVGLPFAFRIQRSGGAMYGLGVSLVLGIVMLAVFAFFSTLGETGALPPVAAVWSPSVIFAALSAYLFLGVRT